MLHAAAHSLSVNGNSLNQEEVRNAAAKWLEDNQLINGDVHLQDFLYEWVGSSILMVFEVRNGVINLHLLAQPMRLVFLSALYLVYMSIVVFKTYTLKIISWDKHVISWDMNLKCTTSDSSRYTKLIGG